MLEKEGKVESLDLLFTAHEERLFSFDISLDNKGFSHIEGDVLMYLITDSPTTI